jgi:anti-sigma regulatory factor (Ser/Thr protein kinase)
MKLLLEQPINGESSVYLLRSRLRAVSRRMGFQDTQREHMELVCNEIVTNQNKYAGGRGLVQIWEQHGQYDRLHIFALDYGPGIANLPNALADGYTSSGTLGKGLGTIQRISDRCDFYTLPDGVSPRAPWHGLAVWAQFRVGNAPPAQAYQSGLYLRAYQDDLNNGDLTCADLSGRSRARWLHLDGLGHGKEAAEGIAGACTAFEEGVTPADALNQLSRRLQGTRGAVAIACEIDFDSGHGRICGVGDMAAYLISHSNRRSLNFSPGILGHSHRHFETLEFELPRHAVMLTASDGIRKSWDVSSFPGLWRTHPQLIAFFLGEVIGRNNDDKSIFAIRAHEQGD